MPLDQADALEAVADDGQTPRPDGVGAPEGDEGEEDVVVRVQCAFFEEDARGGWWGGVGGGEDGDWVTSIRSRRRREEVEEVVGGGEVVVAPRFGEAGGRPGWAAVRTDGAGEVSRGGRMGEGKGCGFDDVGSRDGDR